MLLIHGIRDQAHAWDYLATAFQDQFHVVVPDLRGHGDSEWSKGSTYSYSEYTCDVEQLVRQRELDPVTIVAHSMGGTIASIFAGTYPNRVRRLVMIEPIGLYPEPLMNNPQSRLRHWIASNRNLAGRIPKRYSSIEEAYSRMQQANPHLQPELARYLTTHGSYQNEDGTHSWKFDNHTRASTPYDLTHQDFIGLWSQITCPVLIINSREGFPHRIGQDGTLRHFQNAELVSVNDAGHWTHHDQLNEVIGLLQKFLHSS